MYMHSKKQRLYSLVFVILGSSNFVYAETDAELYQQAFGIDDTSQQNNKLEKLITPLIIFGVEKAKLAVNLDLSLEVVSFESKPFVEHVSTHLNPEAIQQLNQIATQQYIQSSQLPSGIKISLNEDFGVEVSIVKDLLKPMSPTLDSKAFNRRKPFDIPIISSVHDVGLTLTQDNNTEGSAQAVIDSTFRINRALLSGTSTYLDHVSNIFNENWVTQYEDTDRSYFYGYLQSPSFANLNPEKLAKGIAIGNTDLKENIAFVGDARYVDLAYPATVKIYIDNLLHQKQKFTAGRHRLNIPLLRHLSEVRIEVEDVTGRKQSYDFSIYNGSGVESIPLKDNYSYFASYGNNNDLQKQFYGGVEFGLNSISKAQLAVNYLSSNVVIAGKYYQIIPLGSVSSTLSLNRTKNKDNGYSLNTESSLIINPELILNLSHTYDNNLDTNSGSIQNEHLFKLGVGYSLNQQLSLSGNLNSNIKQDTISYALTSRYQLNKATSLNLSYNAASNSESYSSINLNYKFGDGANKSINAEYRNDTKEPVFNLNYDINDRHSFAIGKDTNNTTLGYQHQGDIFNTNMDFEDQANDEKLYKINTKFSIVSAEDLVSLAPILGQYKGFSIIEASDQFIGELGVRYRDSTCKLKRLQRCVLILTPERQLNLQYQKEFMPLGVSINPPEVSVRVPRKGGVKHYLSSVVSYFVEGTLVDQSSLPIQLILGAVIHKDGQKMEIFTDEDGSFFAELSEGGHTLIIPGYQPFEFNVNKEKIIDSVINIGTIQLQQSNE